MNDQLPKPPLPTRLARAFAAQSLRALASTQTSFLVGLHFGWLLIILAAITIRGPRGEGLRGIGEHLLRAYVALGGTDSTGRGGLAEVMVVWGKLSLASYVIALLLDLLGARRKRWSLWRKVALSTAIAAAGYGVGFGALRAGTGDLAGSIEFAAWFTAFTFAASVWAFGIAAFLGMLARAITDPRPQASVPPPPAEIGGPRPSLSYAAGAVLLLAGSFAGLNLPGPVVPPPSAPYARPLAVAPPPPATANPVADQARAECASAAECERSCEAGSAAACGKLGELVEHGLAGASKDGARAVALTARACELGDGLSCTRRASALESENVPERIVEAVHLYRRACELGHAEGCAGVAYVFEGRVNGPPPDPATTRAYFSRACELGSKEACGRR